MARFDLAILQYKTLLSILGNGQLKLQIKKLPCLSARISISGLVCQQLSRKKYAAKQQ